MVDRALADAARSAIVGALSVVAGERVALVGDAEHVEALDALESATRGAGAVPVRIVLEDLAPRPHERLDARVAAAIIGAQASVLLISFHPHELAMRTQLVDLAAERGLRHAHMVGVGRESMVAGLAIDPRRLEEQMRALRVRLGPHAEIGVKSAAGTDLVVGVAPWCRWLVYGGIVRPGKKDNLPSGELVTSPHDVEGVYVADGTLGDADGLLARSLRASPVVLRISAGRVRSVACERDRALATLIERAIGRVPNLDRIGLVGFGLNAGLAQPQGNVFTDQKVPGVHLSLGETFPARTGAQWTSASWIAFTTASCDADIDQLPVLRKGRFVL